MKALGRYVSNVVDAVVTTAVGMRITARYLLQKPITVQYPDERLPVPDRFRGVHYLEQEKCINCLACARACPVACIEMDAVRHGKELEWVKFTIDYQKCMFCELCVYPCPKDCIHMGTEFAMVSEDRRDFVYDLLSYRGMARDAKVRMAEAEKAKQAKEAAKKAKAAAGDKAAAAAGAAKPEKPPKPPPAAGAGEEEA
ncbi:MAG: NADH-quinone oxidoreductase subunit I [Planctomycetota bacterium]